MGNRAVITTEEKKIGVYLHWNGDYNSVKAFLAYCKEENFRPPEEDCYGWACLVQTVRNFFGPDGLSVGIDLLDRLDLDNGDNGLYIIQNWRIIGREGWRPKDEYIKEEFEEMIEEIRTRNSITNR